MTAAPSDQLGDLFRSLSIPTGAGERGRSFTASLTPHLASVRIAKDSVGEPYFLIPSLRGTVSAPPIRLDHLVVQHDVLCRVTDPRGRTEYSNFSIVGCSGGDSVLQAYFIRSISSVLSMLGPEPDPAQISNTIAKLVDLFHSMRRPPRGSVQGLWAETFLLAVSTDPLTLLTAWRSEPEDLYDFNSGDQRIEVKSARGTRRHVFRLEQLYPTGGTKCTVVSILVNPSGAGESVSDLAVHVRARIGQSATASARLDLVIAQTLGEDWRLAYEARFDLEFALESLQFFRSESVPRIPAELPRGVSEVHFTSDLSNALKLPRSDLAASGGIFAAAIPNRAQWN